MLRFYVYAIANPGYETCRNFYAGYPYKYSAMRRVIWQNTHLGKMVLLQRGMG